MRNLVRCLNSGDLRFLLKKYNPDYDQRILVPVFDSIMREYQELKGDGAYDEQLKKAEVLIYEQYKLTVIYLAIQALSFPLLNVEAARQLIDEFRLRYNGQKIEIKSDYDKEAIDKLKSLAKSIETAIKIKSIKEQEEKVTEKQVTWERMRVKIQSILDILPEIDCSVKMYLEYESLAEETVKERQKVNG